LPVPETFFDEGCIYEQVSIDDPERRVCIIRHHEDVIGVVTAEVIPVLMISAAEYELLMSAAAVVDGRQVITHGAQVRELHVTLVDTLASAR